MITAAIPEIWRLEDDIATAFDAFSQAAGSGSEAGRQNLVKLMNEIGLGSVSNQVLEKFSKGNPGGRTL